MNYYDELISSVESLIENKKYQEALTSIQEELKMPYVPKEVLIKFEAYEILCQQALKKDKPMKQVSFNELVEGLFEDDFSAMNSIIQLGQMNLRGYLQEIQSLFDRLTNPVLIGLIILQLSEQKIDYEFRIIKNGLEIKFYPVYIENPSNSDGFIIASKLFSDEFFKEPQLQNLLEELLLQETLSYLPLSYCEEEGKLLAYSIIKKAFLLSNRAQEWYDYTVRNSIDNNKLIGLEFRVSAKNCETH